MLEDLDTMLRKRGNNGCKMKDMLAELDASDRDILLKALEDQEKWSTHGLHVALRQKGLDIGYQSIYRHRRRTCSCWSKDA